MGPAIATSIILNSSLNEDFELIHIKTNINDSVSSMGRFSLGKAFRNLGLYFKLFGKCIGKRPKLVLIPISQTTMGFLKDAPYIWIGWITGRRVLLQLRGSNWKNWLETASPLTRWYVRLTCKRAKGVIVLGTNLRHLFESIFPEDRIYVVPNGGNYSLPDASSNNKVRILYLANYLPTKGFDLFLTALSRVKERNYVVESFGAWDNPDFEATCRGLIEQHNLPVVVNGPVWGEEKLRVLASADLFVFIPQHPEGHPWVIVEAMAAGLPIISTDQGAIIESVVHGKNGLIVPDSDAEATAKALNKLIDDTLLREQMGKASRLHYLNNFTEEKMVEHLRSTFKRVIG